jgi:hypothetical protein
MDLLPCGYRPRGQAAVAECGRFVLYSTRHFSITVKNLSVQALVPQPPVEAFAVPVPWTSRFDVQRPRAHFGQPLPQFFRHELRAIVRANMLG